MAGLIVRCDMREPFQEKLFMPQHYLAASKLAACTDFCICMCGSMCCSAHVFKNADSNPAVVRVTSKASLEPALFHVKHIHQHSQTHPDTSLKPPQLFSSVGDEVIFS